LKIDSISDKLLICTGFISKWESKWRESYWLWTMKKSIILELLKIWKQCFIFTWMLNQKVYLHC